MKTVVESIVHLHQFRLLAWGSAQPNLLVQPRNPEDGIRVFFIDFDACQPNADTIPLIEPSFGTWPTSQHPCINWFQTLCWQKLWRGICALCVWRAVAGRTASGLSARNIRCY